MGAMAKGKINASEARIGDRIVVKVYEASREEDRDALNWVNEVQGTKLDRAVGPSRTKTGAGVVVTTITDKAKVINRRGYLITTGEGEFYAEPIQTMWSAQEDPAGIKRAHAEALAEDEAREAAELIEEENRFEVQDDEADQAAAELEAALQIVDGANLTDEERDAYRAAAGASPAVETSQPEDLTLNSHAGKVMGMNNDANATQTATTRETTGSAVVRLLEKVHQRIRQNHPEVPEVVIVTGAGIGPMGGKWGHFRPEGWMAKDEDSATHIHEMFMAGETLAKGARQVLQTMLHESGHGLAQVRGIQDTSRQHRWHNKAFLTIAQELGLEYRKPKANPQIGYSEVVLTDETIEEYRDLLDELDREIHLMVRLPGWLGGTVGKDGDDEEGDGGENMPKAPRPPAAPNTNNIKAVCRCEEPNIIRLSRKVLDKGLVRCDECEELFTAA